MCMGVSVNYNSLFYWSVLLPGFLTLSSLGYVGGRGKCVFLLK